MSYLFKYVAVIAVAIIALFLAYAIFIYTPVALYAEAKCLTKGYPESRVSVGLEQYCMTLDGTITVKVDKQGGQHE